MDKTTALTFLEKMIFLRAFEQKVEEVFISGAVMGTAHTCIGQEAICIGVGSALNDQDCMTSTHRGHGHFYGKGADPKRMLAEMYGKETGYCGGRGGSQLMTDYSIGYYGANGIVGGSFAPAVGMALHMKRNKMKNVVVCFFGDGAVNQGSFHESLNMAQLWNLPVIFICENNLYGMSVHQNACTSKADMVLKAESYGMEGLSLEWNDVEDIYDLIKEKKEACLEKGPILIEFKTYRFSGHSRGDRKLYRTREEEACWWEEEPIEYYKNKLSKRGVLTKEYEKEIEERVQREILDCVKFSEESSFPQSESLTKGVYCE